MFNEFRYLAPRDLDELFSLMSKENNYVLYAGGTDILVYLRNRIIAPDAVIDIKGIKELADISESDDSITIGATVLLSDIENNPLTQRWYPSLCDAVGHIGSIQIRNKATLAGNIQNASPAADGLIASFALDAELEVISAEGTRKIYIKDFILGPRKTLLSKGEIIKAISFPIRQWSYQHFFKEGRRNALAISVVNGVVAIDLDEKNIVTDARIAVGAVAATPLRITEAELFLVGKNITEDVADKVQKIVSSNVSPISDIRASVDYRKYLAGVMVRKEIINSMRQD